MFYPDTVLLAVLAACLAVILAYAHFTRFPTVKPTNSDKTTPSPPSSADAKKALSTSAPIPGAFEPPPEGELSASAKRKARRKRAKVASSLSPPTTKSVKKPAAADDVPPPPPPPPPEQQQQQPPKSKTKSKVKPRSSSGTPVPVESNNVNHQHQQLQSSASASAASLGRSLRQSSTSIDTDSSWTRVESRARRSHHAPVSDAATTTTGDEKDQPELDRRSTERESGSEDHQQHPQRSSLAPNLGLVVEDSSSALPPTPVSPHHRQSPLSGHSAEADSQTGDDEDEGDGDGDDDDDDDDSGWGIVKSRSRRQHGPTSSTPTQNPFSSRPPSSSSSTRRAPETLTKKQRQNASRHEAEKAAKAEAETERLLSLQRHRAGRTSTSTTTTTTVPHNQGGGPLRGNSKITSGGMTASVDEHGHLVWV